MVGHMRFNCTRSEYVRRKISGLLECGAAGALAVAILHGVGQLE